MNLSPSLANISETCAIISRLEAATIKRLERKEITPRQLRYLEERDVLQPFRPTFERQADGRLYDALSMAFVRIWLRLLVQAVLPDWAARAALAYLRDDLRRELQRGTRTDAVLLMRGVRGMVVSEAQAAKMTATFKLPLASVVAGLNEALTDLRRGEPEIWTGRRREVGSTLATEVLRV